MKMEIENEMIISASQEMPASQPLQTGYSWELSREQSGWYLPQVVPSSSNYSLTLISGCTITIKLQPQHSDTDFRLLTSRILTLYAFKHIHLVILYHTSNRKLIQHEIQKLRDFCSTHEKTDAHRIILREVALVPIVPILWATLIFKP